MHARTWLSPHIYDLFLRYAGPSSISEIADFSIWDNVDKIPDEELWTVKERNRKQLIEFARNRLTLQYTRRGIHSGPIKDTSDILLPKAMTIGFARRFATYKRGDLFFKNIDRLKQILCNKDYPVQIIIAGKAHPADHAGKDIIRHIFEIANLPELKKRIVFIENYDFEVAARMVQGTDIWLNNPRRPMEACGTSGMKAALNGCINLSVLDGWWDEAFNQDVGWSIGGRESYGNTEVQDQIESDLLYATLERDIIPLFFERDQDGLPTEWIKMMKNSIRQLGKGFNSHRMIKDYTEQYYLPAEALFKKFKKSNYAEAKELTAWQQKILKSWENIKILNLESVHKDFIYKGSKIDLKAQVFLGDFQSDNIIVECLHGSLDNNHQIINATRTRMTFTATVEDTAIFTSTISCSQGGHYGYTVRVLPGHPNLAVNLLPNLIKWYD